MRRVVHGIVRRLTGYDAVRVAVGVLLLTAAGLKAHQLATEPILGTGLLDSRWLLMATVEFELFFGLWLLVNIWPKPTWTAAVACFGLFAGVSLYKVLSGEASCGCFGQVQVIPWYTLMGDATAVALLAAFRPRVANTDNPVSLARLAVHATGLLAVWLVMSAPVTSWAIASFQSDTSHDLSALGEVFDPPDGRPIVVLEPEKWIGEPFPLLPFIKPLAGEALLPAEAHPDLGERLLQGKWTLVLYSTNCSECQTYLGGRMSGRIAVEPSHSLALVQISGAKTNG